MILNLLKTAAIVGTATLITGAGLQGAYRATNYYPPTPVFYFFTGFLAYLAIEGVEHLSGHELISDSGHALPTS